MKKARLKQRNWPIHRSSPKFTDQSTETEILVTGIKVIDLLAPYAKWKNRIVWWSWSRKNSSNLWN